MLDVILIILTAVFAMGVVLSAGLWAVGAFGNQYTQSLNGRKGVRLCGALGLASSASSVAGISIGAVVAAGLGLLALSWRLRTAMRSIEWSSTTTRAERLTLAAASIVIPGRHRHEWRREAESFLHELSSQRRHTVLWELVLRAPWAGAQQAFPQASEGLATLAALAADPVALQAGGRRAFDVTIKSHASYTILGPFPWAAYPVHRWLDGGWMEALAVWPGLLAGTILTSASLWWIRRRRTRRVDTR